MTRKTCNNNNAYVGVTLGTGCEELYGQDHSRLRCSKTVAHQRFTRRNSKILHIDDLYRSDSTITKLFLKINDIAFNQQLNNIRRSSLPAQTNKSSPMTRNKVLQQQTSLYDKLKSPISPANSDSYSHLRPRRHTTFVNAFIDSSGDDDSNSTKPMRELRSTNKVVLTTLKTPETKVYDSGRPKRKIKAKRFSIDVSATLNNKNCLKVDVKKSKLKTSYNNNTKAKVAIQKDYFSDFEEGCNAKIKKKRESALTRLNNEAENFLFPKVKEEVSGSNDSEKVTSEDSKTSVALVNSKNELVNGNSVPKPNKSFKYVHEEESMDSMSSEASFRKKKRLTQAEAFILDNQQYYKFENPGSRLRYHGSYLSPIVDSPTTTSTTSTNTVTSLPGLPTSKNNGQIIPKQLKTEENTKKVKKKYDVDRLQFSFEIVPKCEVWFETFQRQDNGQERYTCCNLLTDEKRILLPYELGSLVPLNPRLCYYAYQELRKSFLGDSPSSRKVYNSTTTPCNSDIALKTDNTSTNEDIKTSTDSHLAYTPLGRESRGGLRKIGTSSKTPRKSPRQHASTLAILSNLLQQRRRKPRLSRLPAIQEENELKPDYKVITTFLNSCSQELDGLEVEPEAIDCNIHCKPSAVCALEEYLGSRTSTSKQLSDRKVVRKKRTNKTGWPSKYKRLPFKKEGSHSSSSIIDSTDNNSKNNDKPTESAKTEVVATPSIDSFSANYSMDCVNVDLVKWEKAEKLLSAKLQSEFQPVVRVRKLSNSLIVERLNRISESVRPKRNLSPCPSSPRKLRRSRNK